VNKAVAIAVKFAKCILLHAYSRSILLQLIAARTQTKTTYWTQTKFVRTSFVDGP